MKKTIKKRPEKKKPVTARRTKKVEPKKKRYSVPTLAKFIENPIISPQHQNGWEAWQTFNPGVILLNDKVHFLYRAIGQDGISRLGYAASGDGFTIDERLPYPVYEHKTARRVFNVYSCFSGGSWGGAEDPRIVRVDEEDTLYMTYTACSDGLRVAFTSIKLKDFLNPAPEPQYYASKYGAQQVRYGAGKKWGWKPPVLISPPGEVHKNWVIFPEKINGKYAILHSINPEISIDYFDSLEQFDGATFIKSYYNGELRKNCWDGWIRGVGPVPLKTKYGWLVFYHAMHADDFSKYKVGAMLLDINDPTKVLVRSPEPVLEPDQICENNGFKAGVVYASGAVVKDGNLLVYYGGADSYICVAYANFEEFVEILRKATKPKLQQKKIRKKTSI